MGKKKTEKQKDLTWREATIKVLKEEGKELHYRDIAKKIAEKGYRTALGFTPQDSVNSTMSSDINKEKDRSVFVKGSVAGIYMLRADMEGDTQSSSNNDAPSEKKKEKKDDLQIRSFGIYWDIGRVMWEQKHPEMYGMQEPTKEQVNFKNQIGVYLLHDNREIIYIGRAIKDPIGKRLKDHTSDRLNGRWNRFSWFGFYPIENGKLKVVEGGELGKLDVDGFGKFLEAVLIESIQPYLNRRQGDGMTGCEFIQGEDPKEKNKKTSDLLKKLQQQVEAGTI